MERVLTISEGSIRDVLGGEVEEMRGDPVLRRRVAILLARDCARRKLLAILLPALTDDARSVLLARVDGWNDAEAAAAAREILDARSSGGGGGGSER